MKPKINIAVISTFLPTRCGIATYTCDLIHSIYAYHQSLSINKINIVAESDTDNRQGYCIRKEIADDYTQIAKFLNSPEIDIVDIQHEFKLYGSPNGENILILLEKIKKPIVTTLHTVSNKLNEEKMIVFKKLVERSDLIFVFTAESKELIIKWFGKDYGSIVVIPHGVPEIAIKKKDDDKNLRNGSPQLLRFITTGHMREAKGYDMAIKALSLIKHELPKFEYCIVGADHPENKLAKSYRETLKELGLRFGMQKNVQFVDRYLSTEELINLIQTADICLIPYNREEQSSSGVLSLMIACGMPVISTPFQFAKSVVNNKSGKISRTFSESDFATCILELVSEKNCWEDIGRNNHKQGAKWAWKHVANIYKEGYSRLL